jgi:cell wall-associated NlpC family hydrolase
MLCAVRLFVLTCVIAVAGCASTPVPKWGESSNIQNQAHSAIRDDLVRYAWSALGTPYAWGGADPSGFDCSGLVYYVYDKTGLQVPRTTEEQLAMSTQVDVQQLKPGDLVFFDTGFWQTHVGIYLGKSEFIHAPRSGEDVTISSLKDAYWRETLITGGSFLHD